MGTELDVKNTRRTPRYPLEVDVEVTDLELGMHVKEKTKDLSLFGCWIDTSVVLPRSRKVRIEIVHEDQKMLAVGRVVYVRPDIGMGVAFIKVEPDDQQILGRWIRDLMWLPVLEGRMQSLREDIRLSFPANRPLEDILL